MRAGRRAALALALGAALVGCGGGSPLMHPAHVLRPGYVSFGGGVSGRFALRSPPGSAGATPTVEERFHEVTVAPGIAPWVAGRVGIEGANEAGLTYTGRTARIDARHAFAGSPTVSVGLGAHLVLFELKERWRHRNPVLGGGADVPILVGWKSQNDIYALWVGPRAGFEMLDGTVFLLDDPIGVSGQHVFVGALAGLRAGFRHVHVVMELDAAYHRVGGTVAGVDTTLHLASLTPAGAVVVNF